jgi:MFS family permease
MNVNQADGVIQRNMTISEHHTWFRWVVLGQILIVTFSSAMIMISFAPLMGIVAKDLGISIGAASFGFMGLHMLATAVSCAIAGYLIDRFGVFSVINASMVLLVVSNALLPWLGHSYWTTVAIRIAEAAGCAPVWVAIGPAVALWFPRREAGAATGLQSMVMSIGVMCGLVVSPQLSLSAGSWQQGLAWMSLGLGVATVFVFAVSLMAKNHTPAAPTEAPTSEPSGIFTLLRTRPFLAGMIGLSCGVWTLQTFNSLTPGYLAVLPPMGLGLGALTSGKLMTTVLLAGIVASLVGGLLVDMVFGGRSRPVVLMGFVLVAVTPVLMIIPQIGSRRSALVLCLILTGAGTPFINPVILGFAAKTFSPTVVGKVVGSWMSVAMFSGAVGVMLGAAALDSTGSYRLPMETISAVAVVGLVAAFFIYPGKSNPILSAESADREEMPCGGRCSSRLES